VFAESEDSGRRVLIVFEPEEILIVVTCDPLRTNARVFSHSGLRGFAAAKPLVLPKDWDRKRPDPGSQASRGSGQGALGSPGCSRSPCHIAVQPRAA
jgi:hypothetical protein